ncbi:MAG TPA: molecular chaperone SurA [Thiolapillus brandeum]|uniref:Chaperone SurA n=1 Tax=Thiolapillus brandeum TaxID=1076588 RepID=A0A7C5N4F9_9GAMM|nr:molecular chaperone SurA [Thiolapillus brandeum]
MAIDSRRLSPLLLLPLLWLLAFSTPAQERELLDRIVAVVNDDVVLQSEFDRELAEIRRKLEQLGATGIPDEEVRKQALERLILRKLQLQEAERLGITADDQTLQQALLAIARRNGLTPAEMEEAMKAEGISPEAFRAQLREEITLQRLRSREVINRIQVTKAEVDNYLANQAQQGDNSVSYRIRHILIATPEGASSEEIAQARRKAEEIVARLKKGEDFATLASRYSQGQQALKGGDLGWLPAGQVPTLFAQEVLSMNKGDIRGPLQASSGFHIIKLEDIQGSKTKIVRQTHARHILVRTDEITSDREARIRLEQLYQRIQGGEDFAALARAHSDDKASALKGGDLGWVTPGDLVPKFEEVMNSLEIGQLSQPFRTQFGWHIVQVLDRREKDVTTESKRDEARLAIRKRKSEEALQLYLRKLRDQAFVETRLEGLD